MDIHQLVHVHRQTGKTRNIFEYRKIGALKNKCKKNEQHFTLKTNEHEIELFSVNQ